MLLAVRLQQMQEYNPVTSYIVILMNVFFHSVICVLQPPRVKKISQ